MRAYRDCMHILDFPALGEKCLLRTQHGALDDCKLAPPETIKFVQEVTGLFNHYSRVIDYTMAEAVTAIARSQAAPIEDTLKRVHHLH